MIVAVVEFVALSSHSGMPHDNIAVLMQAQMYLMSGVRALINCKFSVVVECVAGCVCASLLAFLSKHTKQLFTLLRIKGMVVIYQAKYCAHSYSSSSAVIGVFM